MKKSIESLKQVLRFGTTIEVLADDWRYSELLELAQCAKSNSANIRLTVGDKITSAEIIELSRVAKQYLTIILP